MNTKHYLSRFMQRAAMLLLMMLLTTTTAWAEDAINGLTYNSSGEYYEINDWQDLADLATYVNAGHNAQGKTFKVTQDIMFTHTTVWNDASSTENNYTPIGENDHPFSGYFDGQGHTVSGIRIYNGNGKYQGLFGYIIGGEVKNVILAAARITGFNYTGGIVGLNYLGTVTNCHALSDVTIHTVQDDCYYHGGIVGGNEGDSGNAVYGGTVTGCTSAASITTVANWSTNYGGIVGENIWGTIKDCLYLGNTVEGSVCVGGIVGRNNHNSSTVQNSCYTSTTIQGKDETGNILDNANSAVGYNDNGTVTNCGLVSSDDIAQSGDTYTIGTPRGWDTFCGMLYHNNTYNRFSGKTVKLGASISVTRMAGGDYHDFCGTFDGNQKTLTVSYGTSGSPIDENNVAPFRNLQSYCIIKDLHVAGDIYTSGQFAGGLAGTMFGTVKIENCLVSTVIHSYTSGDGTHGGIVGHAGNNSATKLTIEGCAFDGKLLTCGSTSTTNSSGFVGYKHNNGTVSITNSFYAPAALGDGETEITSGSATFMRGGSAGTNCYYTRTLGDAQGNGPDGPCGTNVYYAYNSSTKTLNIFGTGAMTDYSSGSSTPWNDYRSNITTVVIGNGVTSIGNYAFEGCTGLASITIPNSVTSIGNNAFQFCSALASIEIPASVTSIGDGAFMGCSALTSVTIGSGVTSIGTYVFDGCSALTSIEIPASVTSIGENAFAGCSSLTSINVDANNANYASEDGVLFNKAKTTLIQYPIGKSGTAYAIPASVTSIGDDAFNGCSALTSVTIPANVTSIGNRAFAGCSALTSIEIPANVTSIGNNAFAGCSALTSVTIYAPSLTTYGADAFSNNASGRKIYVYYNCMETYKAKASTMGASQDDILPIIDLTYNTAGGYYEINDAQDLADLATYVNAGNNAQGKTFKVTQDIVFTHTTDWNDASSTESNYTAIGISDNPFNGHFDGQGHTISGIRIYKGGNADTDKYQGLFGYINDKTAEVKNVILADARITSYWYVGGIVGKKSKGTVSNCHVRSDVTIHAVQDYTRYHGGIVGENFRTIEGCTSAASITTTATGNAYYGGIAGSNAYIQDTDYVGTITDCLYLSDTVEGSADVGAIAGGNGGIITNSYFSSNTFTGKGNTSPYELTNANSAVGYNDTSHSGCGTTTNVGRAYSVTAGDYVTIETITPSGEVARQYTPNGIKVYGDGFVYNGGFYCINNSSTVSLTLSHSRPGYDFGGYTATVGTLSGTENPYSLTVSGENVVINSNWTIITYNITYNLGYGSVATANPTTYTVETETFTLNTPTWEHFNFTGWTGSNGETPATTVTIEKGSIGDRTYTANYEVEDHDGTCGDNVYYLYDSTSKTLNIFGSGAMADYSANMPWYNSGYRGDITTVVIANGVTHIGSYAFNSCSALTSIEIPASVTSIGTRIFVNCSNLTTITVDAGNTKYDSRNNCNAIIRKSDNVLIAGCKNSIIPNDVTSIGDNAFNGCSSLTSIEIPSSVTSIGGGAFYQCTSLASVIIYAPSLTYYGYAAFDDNASGRKIYVPMASVGTYKTNWPAYENDIVGYNGTCGASGHETDVLWAYEAGTLTIMKVGETGAMADYASATDQPWYSYRENITSVVIEDGVTSIGNHAFDGCSALTSATIYAPSLTYYGTNAFDGNAAGRKIFVYYDCVETYKAKASDMGVDENDIEPISDGTCGTNVYYSYNSNRKTLCIFGTGAMYNYTAGETPWYSYCADITTIFIEDGVTSIGDEAFFDCTGLTSVTIPNSVTSIGDWGFDNCI